jgi:hypothetical protein
MNRGRKPKPLIERIRAKCDIQGECLLWKPKHFAIHYGEKSEQVIRVLFAIEKNNGKLPHESVRFRNTCTHPRCIRHQQPYAHNPLRWGGMLLEVPPEATDEEDLDGLMSIIASADPRPPTPELFVAKCLEDLVDWDIELVREAYRRLIAEASILMRPGA